MKARRIQPPFLCSCLPVAVAGLFLLAGCSRAPRPPFEAGGGAWAYPPDHPRIRHLVSIYGPGDLGIRPGLMRRMAGWVGGHSRSRMTRPHGLAAGDGVLLVADPDRRLVHLMDWKRRRYKVLDRHGEQRLLYPIDVAMGPGGEVYVADSVRGCLYRFGPDGEPLELRDAGDLLRPTGIAYDSTRRRIYVVDAASHRVHLLTPEGECTGHVGRRGRGPGELNYPVALGLSPEGDLLVTDSMNFRVQRFGPDGEWKGALGKAGDRPGHFSRPKGVTVDRKGRIYVVDALFGNVQILDGEGSVLLAFGKTGGGPGEFWLPTGIATDGQGHILVSDSYNRRVQVFEVIP